MFSFKRSLLALITIVILVGSIATLMPLVGRGQIGSNPLKRDLRRSYYLTKSRHDGTQVLSACSEGFHMASISEVLQTANLRYDTTLGETTTDSGFGAPTFFESFGWIRTGNDASNTSNDGPENCNGWTTTSGVGTGVFLLIDWDAPATEVSPWSSSPAACASTFRVWCVED